MKTYKVVSNLRHDGEIYKPGSDVSLSDEYAKPLLDAGTITDPSDVKEDAVPLKPRGSKAKNEAPKVEDEVEETEGDDEMEENETEDSEEVEDGLDELTKDDLAKVVKKEKVDFEVKSNTKKQDIVDAIRLDRASRASEGSDDL